MIVTTGNLWEYYDTGAWAVIPTNIGWKRDGANPMGAGVALQAAKKVPELPKWYGDICKKYLGNTTVIPYIPARMILFPTKPLNVHCPWLSWNNDSDLGLISQSTKQLAKCVSICRSNGIDIKNIAVPLVGCGHGGLSSKDIIPILQESLDDSFILVTGFMPKEQHNGK